MYKLKVKDSIFTIPKQNIRLLAMTKAIDLGGFKIIKDDNEAIDYLKSIGIEFIGEVK